MVNHRTNRILYTKSLTTKKNEEEQQSDTQLVKHLQKQREFFQNAELYEVIGFDETPFVKPFFDFDCSEKDHPTTFSTYMGQKAELDAKARAFIASAFQVSPADLAVSESLYTDKISFHYVVTNRKVKYTDLKAWAEQHSQTFRELFLDRSVYRSYGKFRMIGTSKQGKRSPLQPLTFHEDLSKHFISNACDLPEFQFEKTQSNEQPASKPDSSPHLSPENDRSKSIEASSDKSVANQISNQSENNHSFINFQFRAFKNDFQIASAHQTT